MLKVEMMKLTDIKPYEGNAKKHPQEQIEQIKKSIEEFGMNDPLGVCGGVIVEGHGRYEALKQMGVEEVPVIKLDHLTDEQRRAYTLIHNQLTMNSGFDLDTLSFEIGNIKSFDLDFYGLKLPEIPEQKLNDCEEIDADEFSDDKFECECPRCGFRFNRKR